MQSYSFGNWGPHAKFQTPSTAPSGRIWVGFLLFLLPCESKFNSQVWPWMGVWQKSGKGELNLIMWYALKLCKICSISLIMGMPNYHVVHCNFFEDPHFNQSCQVRKKVNIFTFSPTVVCTQVKLRRKEPMESDMLLKNIMKDWHTFRATLLVLRGAVRTKLSRKSSKKWVS